MIDLPRASAVCDPPHWRPASVSSPNGSKPAMGAWVACPAGHLMQLGAEEIADDQTANVHCRECGTWTHRVRLLGRRP